MGIPVVLLLLTIQSSANYMTAGQEDNEILKHTATQVKHQNQIEHIRVTASNLSHTPLNVLATDPQHSMTSHPSTGCQGSQVSMEGQNCSCAAGYAQRGAAECDDINECEQGNPGPCGYHSNCTNTPGSFLCSCLRGYLMTAGGCQDIDECALAAVTGLQACGRGATCKNSPGSFSCHCPAGFVLAIVGHNCIDVDECSYEESCRRELGNVCVNTEGSYKCVCQTGFREEKAACMDVDECVELKGVCTNRGVCENTLGSYKCVCSNGYRGNGTHCTDVNECVSGVHTCDVNARCGNVMGSYFCQCHQGYSGDGHTCYDVDECAINNGHCEHSCANLPGTYNCVCKVGYALTEDLHNCTGTHIHMQAHIHRRFL
uniref:EGF-like domain-containing protein n=1 Tax=Pygocentrus nattereri TaxID=42514 RepID=A0A3B4BRI5_PYGNA